jgi:hypothetical protein
VSNLRALSLPAFLLALPFLPSKPHKSQMGSLFICANNDREIPRPQFPFIWQGGSLNSTQWRLGKLYIWGTFYRPPACCFNKKKKKNLMKKATSLKNSFLMKRSGQGVAPAHHCSWRLTVISLSLVKSHVDLFVLECFGLERPN